MWVSVEMVVGKKVELPGDEMAGWWKNGVPLPVCGAAVVKEMEICSGGAVRADGLGRWR